jgi:glutamyl-tRNA synthetase
MSQQQQPITRLAPSPTGALHLGNARTFLLNWLLARQKGWRVLLRIEDLDGPRVKRGADTRAIEDLRWLGIDWDEGPIYQSRRLDLYQSAFAKLLNENRAYPCVCSRREAALAASAPHAEDGSTRYGGTCRGRFKSVEEARAISGKDAAIRFRVPDEVVEFDDELAGKQRYHVERDLGDFVIAKSDGTAAYQLAVVVDDAEANVTHIVRGDDLLDSTPRQILLYRALGLAASVPRYAHLPLVVGPDGRRLAKRHGDTRIASYREAGVPAGRVRALLARWSGIETKSNEISIDQMLRAFSLSRIPREKIVMTGGDDAWLEASATRAAPTAS